MRNTPPCVFVCLRHHIQEDTESTWTPMTRSEWKDTNSLQSIITDVSCWWHHAIMLVFRFMKHIYAASKPKPTPGCGEVFLNYSALPDDSWWSGWSQPLLLDWVLAGRGSAVETSRNSWQKWRNHLHARPLARINWHGFIHFTKELGLYLFCLYSKMSFQIIEFGDSCGIQLFL